MTGFHCKRKPALERIRVFTIRNTNDSSEMLKANKQKPGKWGMDDIMNDLKILNKRIKENPASYHWGLNVKKITGKSFFELKDFENWDITQSLQNFK